MDTPTMNARLPVIGLMLGDVTGIGPEISAKLLASRALQSVARVVVIGDSRVLALGCEDAKVNVESQRVSERGRDRLEPRRGALDRSR